MIRLLILFLVLCWTFPATATQLQYKQTRSGQFMQFDYQFLDYLRKPRSLSFTLDQKTIQAGFDAFRPFSQETADKYAFNAMQAEASKAPRGMEITITPSAPGSYQINARAEGKYGYTTRDLEHVMEGVQNAQKDGLKNYIRDFNLIEDQTGKYVMPDHTRIGVMFKNSMQPVARAFTSQSAGMNKREAINMVLNWIQTIPYDQLQDRQSAGGAGFVAPPALIYMNKGDCDTKSVALAGILSNMFSNLRVMMVFVPGHAFLGVNLEGKAGDKTLKIEGQTFVLLEPAGPGVIPAGMISPEAEDALRTNRFSYREFDF